MTPLEVLRELLARVGASQDGAVPVSEAEFSRWPNEAVLAMQSHKLLVRARPTASVICPGCEQECTMPVYTAPTRTGKAASFVVCDKREDINRVPVCAERLRQWRCGVETVGEFVAHSLRMRRESQQKAGDGLWELGLATGKRRNQMLCLRADGTLELVVGQDAVPLAELVRFGADNYSVDSEAIRRLVDAATTGDSRYTPSSTRREARKLDTLALHERWRKEHRALKKRRPEMSDVWFSREIARMGVAEGRRAETIRKHMKR
jgi:hypothetical protein